MNDLRKISIDGRVVEVPAAMTLIQACEAAGVEIPRFCYHERLSIAGNCRMCLVEVVGGPPKPTASCAMQVRDLRPGPEGAPPVVLTQSPMVQKARAGVMEFLLVNHPLDCPICDQGGECDLQDQAFAYGRSESRFILPKRASDDIDLGPLVETHMTRCISCTRCVRFTTEVAGITQMGQTGRGEDAEVTSYLGQTLDSNLQGNIIDLCPVGALTSKPYAFTARPWELTKTPSIDVMDALGSNIRIDTRGREVMRILPRNHDGVNEEWISDKTRFIWDGIRRQRLDRPYIREDGRLRPVSWPEALALLAQKATGVKVAGLVGDLASVEAAYALKLLVESLGGQVESRLDGAALPLERGGYAGTARIDDIDHARHITLIGTNPRVESPVLNARIRKAWLAGAEVTMVGTPADLTYAVHHAGDSAAAIADLPRDPVEGGLIIIGQGALMDGGATLAAAFDLAAAQGGKVLVLHTAAARVGALDVGAATEGGLDAALQGAGLIYALGVDEIDLPEGPFVVYQGSHGDRGAHRADLILPAACYAEESGLFVNTEGRPQLALRAGFPPGEARENWAVLRAVSSALGAPLPWDTLAALRQHLVQAHPHLGLLDVVPENPAPALAQGPLGQGTFPAVVTEFYLTNPIARASALMGQLAAGVSRRAIAAE
ncbi:NADH-quinone oxidoreductase subunit G [Ketogulonicigenium robustum]|uniref:NADH-quinone oxidoreductase n=1 Tax=Ketogulonicigenium robustum TaxID=92947 RepID=A0A1W6P1D0_9RHOB|nr:NADH-quinone oxidoreductase subunit NuoG [Ketogulonicigenium robustum]ARO15223.1 NADH-quinone oxidoreductase subunit G [Ketogulonicigenium robustum]